MTMPERILAAFAMIGSGTYADVVNFLQVKKPKKVLRRMSELVKRGLIFKTGRLIETSKGRKSAEYSLTQSMPKTDKDKKKVSPKKINPNTNISHDTYIQTEIF